MPTIRRVALAFAALASAALFPSSASAEVTWDWGNQIVDDRNSQWEFSLGSILRVNGSVKETFRAYYAATGQNEKQSLAESYDLDDFGIDGPYGTWGIHYSHQWNYWDFHWDTIIWSLSSGTSAKRNYYLGVGDSISYRGKKYDHLKIPGGSDFSIDFDGALSEALFSFTPFTFEYEEDYMRLIPSVDIGLALVGGQYEIDAGAPRGTAVYQNPPVDFVVGGKSSSFIGAGAPMIGLGAEFRVGYDDYIQWISRANLGYFSYSGSTKAFTFSSHREKDLDLDFLSLTLGTEVILPMTAKTCLTLGGRIQYIDISAEIKSKEKSAAEIAAAHERFDKSADFDILFAQLYVGITF